LVVDLDEVYKNLELVHYNPRHKIFAIGEKATYLYIILSGEVGILAAKSVEDLE
jgi:CRP-like cAMP-binding protein